MFAAQEGGAWGSGVRVWSLLRSELLTRIAAGLFLLLSQLTSAGFHPATPHFKGFPTKGHGCVL